MKKTTPIFNILLGLCWVMIVLTGSLAAGSLLSRTPGAPASKPSAGTSLQPTLSPEIQEKLPDLEVLQQQVGQILKGQFKAEGSQQVQLNLKEEQLNQLLSYYAEDIVEAPGVILSEEEIRVQFKIADPDALTALFPGLKEYQSLMNLARGSQVEVSAEIHQGQETPLELTLKQISIAGVGLPSALIKSTDQSINKSLRQVLGKMTDLKISRLEIDAEGIRFEGTVPQALKLPETSAGS